MCGGFFVAYVFLYLDMFTFKLYSDFGKDAFTQVLSPIESITGVFLGGTDARKRPTCNPTRATR